MKKIEYMHHDENIECFSDQFESLIIADSDDESKLHLEYTNYNRNRRRLTEGQDMVAETLEPTSSEPDLIKISCINWRNPNVPLVVDGFELLTFDKDGDRPLDFSN